MPTHVGPAQKGVKGICTETPVSFSFSPISCQCILLADPHQKPAELGAHTDQYPWARSLWTEGERDLENLTGDMWCCPQDVLWNELCPLPFKFICWCLNPPIGLYLKIRPLKRVIKNKWGHNGGTLIWQDRCPYRERKKPGACAQRLGCVKAVCKLRREVSPEPQLCWHLDHGLPDFSPPDFKKTHLCC